MKYFIDEQYLKEYSPLSQNLSTKEILPHIQTVQDIDVKKLLGENLFDDITYKNDNNSLTGLELDLVNKIKDFMKYKVVEVAIPFISIKINNGGVSQNQGQNSNPVGLSEINYLKTQCSNYANSYSERVSDFIKSNIDFFPKYNQVSNYKVKPKNDNDTGGNFSFY